ncbi:BTAD domain-containing putative transcriptional regulator [Microbacterium sp. X-17]|uniref:AfsR/SARP family transcriptional regulator n=1 Tax=Microbacterium sp. X-17 TaxID=3144404 RepID=UPI0031F5032A
MTLASGGVRVQLCGTLHLEAAGERLEDALPGRQGRLLFAYLVLNRHRPCTREELAEAVWPGAVAAHGAGLNPLVSKLRRLLGADALEGRTALRLDLGEDAHVDVEWAEQAVHRAESQVALGHWAAAWGPAIGAMLVAQREFLPGEDAGWIEEERRTLADILVRALDAYAAATLEMGGTELPAAVRAGRRLVSVAPLRETGYQVLMRALQRQGDVGAAVAVYGELRAVLRDELGVSPSPATQQLYASLLADS